MTRRFMDRYGSDRVMQMRRARARHVRGLTSIPRDHLQRAFHPQRFSAADAAWKLSGLAVLLCTHPGGTD